MMGSLGCCTPRRRRRDAFNEVNDHNKESCSTNSFRGPEVSNDFSSKVSVFSL